MKAQVTGALILLASDSTVGAGLRVSRASRSTMLGGVPVEVPPVLTLADKVTESARLSLVTVKLPLALRSLPLAVRSTASAPSLKVGELAGLTTETLNPTCAVRVPSLTSKRKRSLSLTVSAFMAVASGTWLYARVLLLRYRVP